MAHPSGLTYGEQLERAYRKAAKKRTPEQVIQRTVTDEMAYYAELATSGSCASVSWERFKGSWAGEEWLKRRQRQRIKNAIMNALCGPDSMPL